MAMRTPISRVRAAAAYDATEYTPAEAVLAEAEALAESPALGEVALRRGLVQDHRPLP